MDEIVRPTARAMAAAGTPFNGVLYAGLMLTADGPKLIEYNVRFGDPECEAIMPRIDGDFAEMLRAVATGRMAEIGAAMLEPASTMTVIVAASGYPGTPAKRRRDRRDRSGRAVDGVTVFHAGTAASGGRLVASGGRVLAVTAAGETASPMPARAPIAAVDQIDFADGFHRRDIGWRELERNGDEPADRLFLADASPSAWWSARSPRPSSFGASCGRARTAGVARRGDLAAAVAGALLWSGPLGGARPLHRPGRAARPDRRSTITK